MALIKCKECGKEISDKAEKCPNCGYSVNLMINDNKEKEESPKNDFLEKSEVKQFLKANIESKKIKLIFLIVVVAVAIIGGTVYLNRLSPLEAAVVQSVSEKIDSISEGHLTENQIILIEADYDKLNSKCKRYVKNRKILLDELEQINKRKAETAIEKINKLNDVEINQSIESNIKSARDYYNELTDKQKKMVENYKTLETVENSYGEFMVNFVIKSIDDIGTVSIESKTAISTARKIYDKLSDDSKKKIKNYNLLVDAETKYSDIVVEKCIAAINSIGEVTLENNKMIVEAENLYSKLDAENKKRVTNSDTLKKSKEKYDTLKKAEEERQKLLSNGDVVSSSQWQVEFIGTNLSAKILPNSASGYFLYYQCNDDEVYLDIIFKLKNIDTDILNMENAVTDVTVTYNNKYKYTNYSMFSSEGNKINSVYSYNGLNALDSTTFHVAVTLPREAQSNNAPIKVEITIAGQKKIINVRGEM